MKLNFYSLQLILTLNKLVRSEQIVKPVGVLVTEKNIYYRYLTMNDHSNTTRRYQKIKSVITELQSI